MGKQVIKQPDGRFAIYSTVVDSLIVANLTRGQLVKWFDRETHRENVRYVRRTTHKLDTGQAPYFQFTMSWEEALADTKENFPNDLGFLEWNKEGGW